MGAEGMAVIEVPRCTQVAGITDVIEQEVSLLKPCSPRFTAAPCMPACPKSLGGPIALKWRW